MSWLPSVEPTLAADRPDPAVDIVLVPRVRDVAGFSVRRVLPSAKRKMVGPFIFLDQMGPALLDPGDGLDVRPHPHIGLATVTYLFDGELLHRDSEGSVQAIRPGDLNWMTAGRGIAHSERTPPELRARGGRVFGLQMWVALPAAREDMDPAFAHHAEGEMPIVEDAGTRLRVVAGRYLGVSAPAETTSETLLADAVLERGARLPVPASHEERAIFIAEGRVLVGDRSWEAGPLLVLKPGEPITIEAEEPSRVVILGGAPMDGPRHIWWNFVSSSKDRIEQAKADWVAGRFKPVPGETDLIPLPI